MYVIVEEGVARKYTYRQLKKDNPMVSFPKHPTEALLAFWNIFPVTVTDEPAYDEATKNITQEGFVLNGDQWETVWVVSDKTPEEVDDYEKEDARKADLALMKADAQVLALLKARPNRINNYIENNVTDLASAKKLLKILSRSVAVLAHSIVN